MWLISVEPEQVEEFALGKIDPHFFQGGERHANKNFNDQPEEGGVHDAAWGTCRRWCLTFFSAHDHSEQYNAPKSPDDGADDWYGEGFGFKIFEMIYLLIDLTSQGIRFINEVQPRGGHAHQESELFLRAICRHDKSVLISSAVAGAMGVIRIRLNMIRVMAETSR